MKMGTVILNNGVEMPLLGLSTAWMDEEQCEQAVADALRLGYRLIDMAQCAANEAAVGRALRRSEIVREDLFLTAKLSVPNTTYDGAKASCFAALEALGVDHLDLFLLSEPYNDVFGAWRALNALCAEGVVHAIGVCNFQADRLADLLIHSKGLPQVVQFERHPYYQQTLLLDFVRRQDMQAVAWGPLAEYRLGLTDDPVIGAIAARHGKTPSQVTLCWQIQRKIIAVLKTADPRRMEENRQVFNFVLTEEELAAIDALDHNESLVPEHFVTPEWLERLCYK